MSGDSRKVFIIFLPFNKSVQYFLYPNTSNDNPFLTTHDSGLIRYDLLYCTTRLVNTTISVKYLTACIIQKAFK